MKNALLDRRISGIIRWLERLEKSYTSGQVQSALMDAECARADFENLRRDMWAKVQPEEISTRKIFPAFMSILRPAFLAAIIILLAVVPLAKDVPMSLPEPTTSIQKFENIVLAEPVIIEYKDEQQQQQTPVAAASNSSVSKKKASKPVISNSSRHAQAQASTTAAKTETVKTVPYDKVFSLMQTGQRALKNNNSTIKIQ